ncbi:acyl-coenzyme A:6-aminopenicillanic acid acyl-transferase [Leptospira fainei serovar Hurstbridge str. BUT 6]|uniref:Acyl-coenzyme A:6-aminopenicillanic acid acyl-transferase n=2 Tax=Leptospira fainei TaxID=48782 RepID=S3VHI2_9LEPT|nr:acyl-coenzyme A:6-aminopenicillanic acid acyl-transferase [Leptospira fainei serovar Hurstbridge str. BUT 6]
MGRQFGEIMNVIGQFEPIFDFYPAMAQNLLLGSLPRGSRNSLAKGVTSLFVKALQGKMKKHRPAEFSKRTLAALAVAGQSSKIERELFTMDAFQNAVGLLGKIQILPELGHITGWGNAQLVPACTSVAVWGDQSQDGNLYHARNFDFPGVDVWDLRPIIVFCTPTSGLRYGYIACRGADVPGITAFNEAGLTIAFHTRFHRQVGFGGLGVIDFGHKIISEAKSIDDAARIARSNKINSTWGAIVTNYTEKGPKAAVIETNYGDVDITYSNQGAESFVNTNHYLSSRLQQGELLAAPVFSHHSQSRYDRAQQLLDEQKPKGTSVLDLQNLLNDSIDPTSGGQRVMGSTIRQITSVKSVVMSPEAQKIYISVGTAPTGGGPYIEIPMSWESPGHKIIDFPKKEKSKNGKADNSGQTIAVKHYKNAMLLNDTATSANLDEVIEQLQLAGRYAENDPSLLFLEAMLHLEKDRFRQGGELLEKAVAYESSPFRKRQAELWLARTYSASGKRSGSEHFYKKVRKSDDSSQNFVWKKKAFSDNGSYSARKLRKVSPNFLLVDANEL